jgi:hypothetical protein
VLGWLNDAATKLFCSCQRCLDVPDSDEEQDFVLSALARADGDKVPPSTPVSINV